MCDRNAIQLMMPEDTLTLTVPTHSAKVSCVLFISVGTVTGTNCAKRVAVSCNVCMLFNLIHINIVCIGSFWQCISVKN